MEELIKKFLSVGDGYSDGYSHGYSDGDGSGDGYGTGYGNGYGAGYGYGNGYGDGYGYGTGSGYDFGYGNGYGSGNVYGDGYSDGYSDGHDYDYDIKTYNGQEVYIIDNTQTLIDRVHANYAKGSILKEDLITEPCYIAKVGDYFAHGKTLKQALRDAQAKYDSNKPLNERIADFMAQYPTLDTVCKGADLFRWHSTLTGSCEFGRQQFCKEHGINPDKNTMTVAEFIDLTKDAYGSDAIRQLKEAYN